MSRHPSTAGPLLAALLASGCVQVTYGRIRLEEPIPDAALQRLRPDQSDLGACLQALGAPHFVWEHDGSGVAVGYVWQDKDDFGLDVSYSWVDDAPGASFQYGHESAELPGCVLWFDNALILRRWQRGTMGELTRTLRRRPAAVDDAR